jgi:hypothetical protein
MRLFRGALVAFAAMALCAHAPAEVTSSTGGSFILKQVTVVPCDPVEAFDAFTGDVTPWWDHSFSGSPHRMYIEPRPGGGFVEIFDSAGNGALHATVITVRRGKLLRFDGPLGLSGRAIANITTCTFDAAGGDSCRITVEAHLSGEIDEKLALNVDGVWHHFLIERFTPYITSGSFRTRRPLKP